ncbi:MAG: hypothetical protein ACI35P_15065 [Bacillus sp. (in: firmicutes)]
MAKVKCNVRVPNTLGDIFLVLQVDDQDGYEVEIRAEQGHGGALVTLNTLVFGQGAQNESLAGAFLGYADGFLRSGDLDGFNDRVWYLSDLTSADAVRMAESRL